MGQFVAPLAILGVGLIGEWLIGPKKSATAAPDSMPSLNGASRGSPLYVTFGTNRVGAQVTWTKNFTPVRQKSSGKGGGKGGGSGGFGSAKGGGSAATSYLYYWDMMFHFGIYDQPSMIRRGWVGADDVEIASLDNITAGGTSAVRVTDPIGSFIPSDETAQLTFTEAFFAPGWETGNVNLESWAYFESQQGFACQWPNTLWIGFNQLALGQSPSVPQISIEAVPIAAGTFEFDPHLLSENLNETETDESRSNYSFLETAGGTIYTTLGGTSNGMKVINPNTLESKTIDSAQFLLDCAAIGMVGDEIPVIGLGGWVVQGLPYFFISGHGSWGTNRVTEGVVMYEVDDDFNITVVGGCLLHYHTLEFGWFDPRNQQAFGQFPNGDLVAVWDHSTTTRVITFPSPASMKMGLVRRDADDALYDITEYGGHFMSFNSSRSHNGNSGFLPPGDSSNTLRMISYIGKGDWDYAQAHSGDSDVCPYIVAMPGPGYVETDIGETGYAPPELIASPVAWDYSDVGLNSVGGTGDARDDYYGITYQPTGYIMQARRFSDDKLYIQVNVFAPDGTFLHTLKGDYTDDISDTGDGPLLRVYHSPVTRAIYVDATYLSYWETIEFGFLGGGLDVTPPYIVKRILTSPIFGFQTNALFGFSITDSSIDDASYQAANQYCIDQGIMISVSYQNQDNLLTILNELTDLWGGFLTEIAGTIYFNTVTGADDPVAVVDNRHLIPPEKGAPPVQTTKGALEDGYNKVQMNYLDRGIDYKQNQVELSDEVDIDINGPRVKTYQARYVMTGSTASIIAARALWSNLYGKDQYAFQLGWNRAHLTQGDLITLVDSFDPTLSGGVRARITNWSEPERGKFTVAAVREFPYIIQASAFYSQQTSVDAGYGGLVEAAQAPDFQTAYELPAEFQASQQFCFFGYNQKSSAMGAQLYISHDGESYVLTQDTQPFILSGRLHGPLEKRQPGYVEDNVDFWLLPTPDFDPATPTFIQNYDMDDVSAALRSQGAGVLIVGSEAISVEGLTLLGQNHYRARRMFRGWGGTPINSQTSGAYFHQHAAGIFNLPITLDDIHTTISYKIAPYNFAGHTYDVTSIDARTYTIKGTYWLPREQPHSKFYVASGVTQPASSHLTGPFVGVHSGGCDLAVAWADASNVEGYGAGGFGGGTYGHFVADSDGHQWRVDIASKNGVKVSSFVVTSPYFNYTLAQNSADFAGFGRDLVINVTPFNVKGDGPVSDVQSISMNW